MDEYYKNWAKKFLDLEIGETEEKDLEIIGSFLEEFAEEVEIEILKEQPSCDDCEKRMEPRG